MSRAGLVRALAAVSAALLLALLVAACGDDRLSESDFKAKATKICQNQRKVTARIRSPQAPGDVPAFLRRGLRVVRPAYAKLDVLKPPKSKDALYRSTLDAVRAQLALIAAGYTDVRKAGDPVRIFANLHGRLVPLRVRANRGWKELSLTECVNS